jgi:hypothetical protein
MIALHIFTFIIPYLLNIITYYQNDTLQNLFYECY